MHSFRISHLLFFLSFFFFFNFDRDLPIDLTDEFLESHIGERDT